MFYFSSSILLTHSHCITICFLFHSLKFTSFSYLFSSFIGWFWFSVFVSLYLLSFNFTVTCYQLNYSSLYISSVLCFFYFLLLLFFIVFILHFCTCFYFFILIYCFLLNSLFISVFINMPV